MEPLYTIPVNENQKELLKRGTPLFPCSVYDIDLRQYIGSKIPPHWHPEMEIFLLTEGTAHVSLANREFNLLPGEGYFVNSNVLHSVSCPAGSICHFHSAVFDPAVISGASGSAYDLLYVRPFAEHGCPSLVLSADVSDCVPGIIRLFETAFQACRDEKDAYEFTVRDCLSRIFLLLRRHGGSAPARHDSQQELRLKQMLSWLNDHYMEPVTLSQLADCAGICIRECQRSFSNILHTTPVQYLNHRRISAAAKLLVSSGISISEAGLRCGFDNPSYFAKQFKKITGMTPGAYRRKYSCRPSHSP